MKEALTSIDIEQIILMAWGDTIPFETIELEYGLTETQVRKIMRANQTKKPTSAGASESKNAVGQAANMLPYRVKPLPSKNIKMKKSSSAEAGGSLVLVATHLVAPIV